MFLPKILYNYTADILLQIEVLMWYFMVIKVFIEQCNLFFPETQTPQIHF